MKVKKFKDKMNKSENKPLLHPRICYKYLNTKKCEEGSFCQFVHLNSKENKIVCKYQKFQCECAKYDEITKNLIRTLGGCLMCKNTGILYKDELSQILDNRNSMCKCSNQTKIPYPYHKKLKSNCLVCESCKGIIR